MIICKNISEEHRQIYRVAGCELRFLRYADYNRLIMEAGISQECIGQAAFLANKEKLGTPLEEDEAKFLQQLQARLPVGEWRAACFLNPQTENRANLAAWVYSLPYEDRVTLELWLEHLANPQLPAGADPITPMALFPLSVPLAKDIDSTNITVHQFQLLNQINNIAREAAKEAQETAEGPK